MTREEAWNRIDAIIEKHEVDDVYVTINNHKDYDALRFARKLLEQEPCNDTISRQAVLDIDFKRIILTTAKPAELIEQKVKALPPVTPQPKWIPVSERSPEENGWYQCTVILNALPLTMDLFYKNGKWLDNRRIDIFDTYDIYGYGNTIEKHKLSYQELISEFDLTKNVVAWKPLSQPYKAKSEGQA